MPPKLKQRGAKSSAKSSSKPQPQPREIPPPFTEAPRTLDPLLSRLDPSSVYIIHTDTLPVLHKRNIFAVPIFLNLLFAVLLLWRLYYALPHYWQILMSVLGNQNSTTIYFGSNSWGSLIYKIGKRMIMFTLDFMLFRIVGPWPWSFFLERPGNPISWRWAVGFREEEIYVRENRGWKAVDLLGVAEGSSGKAGQESPFFKTRILPAVDKRRLAEKTGYLLMDKDWDLDFFGMTVATSLADKKEIEKDYLRKSVFVFVGDTTSDEGLDAGKWAIWDCSKLDEGSETEAREKVIQFKDKLTAMGKENLFFRWVELIQFESSAPGGFTKERQVAAAEKAKKMFEEQGVDWEEFSRDIDGMPSM
ncbi:hypothetical protein ACN47E_005699 [Coniothyrium glycines]